MRRKRFQRGCLKTRKRNGKNYWYAQWREEGKPKSKEIGLCSKMDRVKAEGILTEILKPINEGAENPEKVTWTFAGYTVFRQLTLIGSLRTRCLPPSSAIPPSPG